MPSIDSDRIQSSECANGRECVRTWKHVPVYSCLFFVVCSCAPAVCVCLVGWLIGWCRCFACCLCEWNSGKYTFTYESRSFYLAIPQSLNRVPHTTHATDTIHEWTDCLFFLLFVFRRIHRHCVSHSFYLSQWTALRRTHSDDIREIRTVTFIIWLDASRK